MKKILLLIVLFITSSVLIAQGVFFVEPPASTSGAYEVGVPNTGFDFIPDINDFNNNVTGVLIIAEDAEQNDVNSENDFFDACEPLINADSIQGKIALVYRGLCEFGSKALRCQEAGAIGVVIINRDNTVINMDGGVDGTDVTIPIVMITEAGGIAITDEMLLGDVTGTIGTFNGLFENNVGTLMGDFLLPRYGAHRTGSASLDDDFFVGTWVRNFGTVEQNVKVEASIGEVGEAPFYNDTTATQLILPGDSVFFALSNYTDGFGEGIYNFSYDIQTTLVDSFIFDNSLSFLININENNLTYARATEDAFPLVTSGTRPAEFSDYYNCVAYQESNASNTEADGVYFSAFSDDGLAGEFMQVTAYAFNNEITDWNTEVLDVLAAMDLEVLSTGDYEFSENLTGQYIYAPFEVPVALVDDQRYLFCITTFNDVVRLGYDQGIDAGLNTANYNTPSTFVGNDGTWFTGFTGGGVPTLTVKLAYNTVDIEEVSDEDLNIIAYPNPAIDEITIPLKGSNKVVAMDVFDLSGKLVLSQSMKQNSPEMILMDVSELESGYYSFKALFENGKSSTFNVVVNK